MNWSFQLYGARNFQPWSAVLELLAQAGYTQVEGYGALYSDPAAFRDELDRNGLSMPTGHFSMEMLEKDWGVVRRVAETFEMSIVICPAIPAPLRPTDAAGWRGLGERLARVGDAARAAGFEFAWHNHDFEFVRMADGSMPMEHILSAAPEIGWEMDLGWAIRAGTDPRRWIDREGRRIVAVHVKDIAKPGERLDEDGWSDVGHGTIDWAALMKAVRAGTAARHYVMEHDNPNDVGRFARRSIEAARTF